MCDSPIWFLYQNFNVRLGTPGMSRYYYTSSTVKYNERALNENSKYTVEVPSIHRENQP